MKKSERLNQELIYLQDRKQFNLSDLMLEFEISKRTALRDISELESLGVALYSEPGRYGKYHILNRDLLTPIHFNEDEIESIFFAIQSLEKLSQTPFDKTYPQIYKKLLASLSEEQAANIRGLFANVFYKGIPAVAKSDFLKDILLASKSGCLLEIDYVQFEEVQLLVYVYGLFFQDGVWFFDGYDVHEQSWGVYRCDYIKSCQQRKAPGGGTAVFKNKDEAKRSLQAYRKNHETLHFQCLLSPFGKELFLKTNYYDMQLSEKENGEILLTGEIEEKNLPFLVQYLISFGDNITICTPDSVKLAYKNALTDILSKYN